MLPRYPLFCLVAIWVALIWSTLAVPTSRGDEQIRFNRDIRPILSENCFHCHGPDEEARTAGLRLDREDGAKEYAIVAGDSDASELVARITADDAELRMPPADSERSLTAEQIDLIRRWIDAGADYEEHWAFEPPSRPEPPAIESQRGRTLRAIDRFIEARLESSDLAGSPPASRTTLIRRATFDLIGLPPTLEEIDAFVNDTSPYAYQRLLDRLLARPEFGERMAADWMDISRYSDTYGYQVDRDRFVWPWRDWVIRAFNQNMPYDQFITWQLAGDLLPDADSDQILATTFNRLHPQKVEGGSVPEEFRIEYVADRTQTVATALMGLTMECCRCHSHKYDPLTQREYYELSAFFDKIDEAGLYSYFTSSVPTPTLKLPTAEQKASLAERAEKVERLEQKHRRAISRKIASGKLGEERPKTADDFAAVLTAEAIATLDFDQPPQPPNESVAGVVGKAVRLSGDDPVNTKVGNFARYQPFSVSLWIKTPDRKDRAVIFHRSRAWTDAASRGYQLLIEDGRLSWSLIHFWPGNAISIRTQQPIAIGRWLHVAVTSDGSSDARGLQIYVDGEPADTEIVRNGLTRNITGGGGDHITIGERFRDRGFTDGLVDQFRVYDCQLSPWEIMRLAEEGGEGTRAALQVPAASSARRQQLLHEHSVLRSDEAIQQLASELQEARRSYCELEDTIDEIMVMREADAPRQTYLLERGAYDQRGEAVEPGTPAVLGSFPDELPRNRLGLAEWLTDDRHPLTARVAANRLWQQCFGIGLVRTAEDFGSQGEPPTHPQLLDWLAMELVDSGWDIKWTLKQIMMSATYRRSSVPAEPSVTKVDPENRLLARFPAYRLPAEMLRDSSLMVSGNLVSKIGGPPVRPYELEASFKPSKRDSGSGLYRRSLYTYWKRTGPAPAMMALDAAKRDVCQVRRERTSSPIQAFVLLNGPQYVEAARGLAARLLAPVEGAVTDQADRDRLLNRLFRILTSRQADDRELGILNQLYDQQLAYFRERPDRVASFLAVGDGTNTSSLSRTELAALTVVASTLMNYDETVMKR